MKKVIVTGGSGFIGSNLIKYLLNKKYIVINIDKLSYSSNPYNLRELNNNKNYFFFLGSAVIFFIIFTDLFTFRKI